MGRRGSQRQQFLHRKLPRVACLFPVVLPQELNRLRTMGKTFARHCSLAKAFAAPTATALEALQRMTFSIRVVSLASNGDFDMAPDGEFESGWDLPKSKAM